MEEKHQQEEEDSRDNPLHAAQQQQHGRSNPDSDNDEGESVSTMQDRYNPQLPGNMALMDEQRIEPSFDASINAADVLCGRGKMSFNHVGNKRFRDAVTNALEDYMRAETRFEKSLVVHRIVDNIHAEGGRFLKKDFREGRWYELSQQHAKEKAGHAIRDAANLYESRQKKEQEAGRRLSGDFSASAGGTSRGSSVSRKPPPSYATAASVASLPSHHEYSVSSPTSTGAKRHGNTSISYEPQRKRRRTASPLHRPAAEEALSAAPVLAASLPRNLKRSPIVNPPPLHRQQPPPPPHMRHSRVSVSATAQQLHPPLPGDPAASAGSMAASLPPALQRSPIEQQQQFHLRQQEHHLQQQQHQHIQPLHVPPQLPHESQQRVASYSTFDPMQYGRPVLQQQQLPQSLPMAPHAAAAAASMASSLLYARRHLDPMAAAVATADPTTAATTLRVPPGLATSRQRPMPPEPPPQLLHHHLHDPGGGGGGIGGDPSYDPRDPVARMQMMEQHRQRDLYFRPHRQPQQQQQQHQQQPHIPPLPGARTDENDHFLAAINAVLGPLPPDVEYLMEPYDEDTADAQHDPPHQLYQRRQQHEQPQRLQLQHQHGELEEEEEEDEPPPDQRPSPR